MLAGSTGKHIALAGRLGRALDEGLQIAVGLNWGSRRSRVRCS